MREVTGLTYYRAMEKINAVINMRIFRPATIRFKRIRLHVQIRKWILHGTS
jgi:hypothetical protein